MIEPIDQWVSPRLNIRFDFSQTELQIYHPDGTAFLTYGEIAAQAKQAEVRAEQAEAKAAKLAARLRALGIDPDQE